MIGDEVMFVVDGVADGGADRPRLADAYPTTTSSPTCGWGWPAAPSWLRDGDYFGPIGELWPTGSSTSATPGRCSCRTSSTRPWWRPRRKSSTGVAAAAYGCSKTWGRVQLWSVAAVPARRPSAPAAAADRRRNVRWERLSEGPAATSRSLRVRGVSAWLTGQNRGAPRLRQPRAGRWAMAERA